MSRPTGTISNITGLVQAHELSIIEMKVLENLSHETIGALNTLSPSNPKSVEGGGTAVFRIQKLIKLNDYTAANRGAGTTPDLPVSEVKVMIDKSISKQLKYEIESLDEAGLAFDTRAAFLSNIAGNMSKSLMSYLDSKFLETIIIDMKAKAALNDFTPQLINADWNNLDTKEKREAAYLQLSDARIDISREINQEQIGTDDDYNTMIHKRITSRLLLAMPKAGNSATEVGRKLANGSTEVAGLGIVKDSLFFNQTITSINSFDKVETFDFSNIYGVIVHREAVFVATQALKTTAITNLSHNQEICMKFNLFQGMVRDDLYRVLVATKETGA